MNDILKLFKWYSNERKAVGSGHVRKDRAHRFFVRVVFVLFETRRFCKVERFVFPDLPAESSLTSFSVLFAGDIGDINAFVEGAAAIHSLTPQSRVLIAEACTHAPLTEDIGTVKIPRLLRKRIGGELQIDFVSGNDFPIDLSRYDLIIHCGACMFNRKYVLNRIAHARAQHIPMTNYGVAIACLSGILDKIIIPWDGYPQG